MRLEDKQEQLSLAALHATCAKAGFGYGISGRIQDNWGWDAEATVYEKLDEQSVLTDFKLKFQVKATRQDLALGDGRFSFPLEVAHYNRLRAAGRSDAPTYLVVFHMPGEEGKWFAAAKSTGKNSPSCVAPPSSWVAPPSRPARRAPSRRRGGRERP